MLDQAIKLSAAIKTHDVLKQEFDSKYAVFAAENADLIASLEAAQSAVKNTESDLRQAIVEDYQSSGHRPVQLFAGIQLRKSVEYNTFPLAVWMINRQPDMVEAMFKVDERALTKVLANADEVPALATMLSNIPAKLVVNPVAVIHKNHLPYHLIPGVE